MGPPLEEARILTQQYDKLRQDTESQVPLALYLGIV